MDLIKERLYYTIGEVSSILGINPSTIRYWEKRFPILKPSKRTGTSKRKFDLVDIQTIYKIKIVLKDEKITIRKAQILLQDWKPDISFESFKSELERSNRPEVIISKDKFAKINETYSEIKKLLSQIK